MSKHRLLRALARGGTWCLRSCPAGASSSLLGLADKCYVSTDLNLDVLGLLVVFCVSVVVLCCFAVFVVPVAPFAVRLFWLLFCLVVCVVPVAPFVVFLFLFCCVAFAVRVAPFALVCHFRG